MHELWAQLECQPRPLEPWEWATLPLIIVGVPFAYFWATGWIYGWTELARCYPRVPGQLGWKYSFQGGKIGRYFWGSKFKLILTPEFAVFRNYWPMSWLLKPIFVPWSSLKIVGTINRGRTLYREFELDHPTMKQVLIEEATMLDFESRPPPDPPSA